MSTFVSCTATSVQLGHKRFPDRHERPQVKAWRCDLTALSRSHNFYFIACNDAIYVYQPRFPDQSIPGEPVLILHPPTTSPGLQPGIDHEDAHSITRLHVDYIGEDEIILVTCDDGDVIGYRTVEIQHVINEQREASVDDAEGPIEEPVKTFLHRNVGASAWGLAIHREARTIAISANTHKVTVIAYALAQPDENSDCSSTSSGSDLEDSFDKEDQVDFPSPRRRDHIIVLPARHNVPSVSFNNSGDDPSGRWLSSCSINGETLIWDLHSPDRPARTIRLGYCASVKDPTKAPKNTPGTCACLRPSGYPHAIWSTMFLDANTAYENVSLKDLAPPPNQPFPYIRDVSKDKRSFTVMPRRNFSATHAHPDEPAIEEASSEMEVSDTGSIASIDSEILSISSLDSTTMEDVQQLENVEMETNQLYESSDESHISGVSTGSPGHIVEAVAPVAAIAPAINAFGPWFQPADQNFPTMVSDDTDDESDTDDELVIPSSTHIQMTSDYLIENTRAYCEVITSFTLARQPQINSPLLIVTKEDVYLYQRPLDYAGDHSDYIVTMRRPLHPNDLHIPCLFIPGSHDRHCYTTQIPELGVFIVASPNGRAGVFSLTRAPGHANPQASGRPQFGFQLEYILPFADRDDRKVWDVEGARLIGVAAGPVQGMLDSESGVGGEGGGGGLYEERRGKRRWRVMMYYTDHTVLAFELGRKRGGVDVDVEALVV